MSDDDLRAAYESTHYHVDDAPVGPFHLRIGETSRPLDDLLTTQDRQTWAYITACNPSSIPFLSEDNARRMRELEERIRGLDCVVYRGAGVGTLGNWPPEPSLLLLGVDEEQAVALGEAFGQRAIVVGERGGPARLRWILPPVSR
jgi:Protein of unknown function (DUF3293)